MSPIRSVLTIAGLTPESGGPSRSVPSLALALADAGVHAEIISLDYRRESPPLVPDSTRVRTHLITCHFSRYIPTLWASRFTQALRQCTNPRLGTIIHDNGVWLPTNHLTARFASRLRLPLLVSPRGMLSDWAFQFRGLKKRIAWFLYQRRDLLSARVFVVTSSDEAADLRRLGFPQPIAIIPNGVEIPALARRNDDAARIRTLLFLSRIHPKKGLAELIDAWHCLRPTGWKVVVAGSDEGGYASQLYDKVRNLGLEQAFSFIGPVEGARKSELYRTADLFVLPSHSENFGIVVAEALAAGLPVITTQGTPWRDLPLRRCGWWIPLTVDALAQALCEALKLSDAERQAMGSRGYEFVKDGFSWQAAGNQTRMVYEWVLGMSSRPHCIVEH